MKPPSGKPDTVTTGLWVLALLVFIGAALRIDLLLASDWSVDSDEAIVGLMAKHIVETGKVPIFFYGQHYMGSFEPLLVSVLFRFFGIGPFVLKLVPLLFAMALVPLTYGLGVLVGGRTAGLIGALLVSVAPSAFIEWSTKPRGGFIEVVALGVIALILGIRLLTRVDRFRFFLLGLVTGFGWWTNNQIVFVALPLVFFLSLRLVHLEGRSFFRWSIETSVLIGVGTIGFFLGSAPFWAYNFSHDFASFGMFGVSERIGDNFSGFLDHAVPILLGAKRFWHTEEIFPGSCLTAAFLVGIPLLVLIVTRWKEIGRCLLGRVSADNGTELLLLVLVATGTVFVVSSFGFLVTAPRYLLPAYPVLYVLIGTILSSSGTVVRTAFVTAILALNLASSYLGGLAVPGEPFVFKTERASRDHSDLISWLGDNRIRWVKTNYWIGYKLAFETKEQVRFLMFGDPFQVRISSYEEEGNQIRREEIPYILTPKQGDQVAAGLRLLGFHFESISLSGYRVLFHVRHLQGLLVAIPSDEIEVQSSLHPAEAKNAIDESMDTRWGTGRHQEKGQRFVVRLPEGGIIRAITMKLGRWTTDYPRDLGIECVGPDGRTGDILPADGNPDEEFASGGRDLEIYFEAKACSEIVLRQEGDDPVFDWSIAELKVWR